MKTDKIIQIIETADYQHGMFKILGLSDSGKLYRLNSELLWMLITESPDVDSELYKFQVESVNKLLSFNKEKFMQDEENKIEGAVEEVVETTETVEETVESTEAEAVTAEVAEDEEEVTE